MTYLLRVLRCVLGLYSPTTLRLLVMASRGFGPLPIPSTWLRRWEYKIAFRRGIEYGLFDVGNAAEQAMRQALSGR